MGGVTGSFFASFAAHHHHEVLDILGFLNSTG